MAWLHLDRAEHRPVEMLRGGPVRGPDRDVREHGPDCIPRARGRIGGYPATAGSPMPITFSRRDSAVKANSFISWLVKPRYSYSSPSW